MKVGRLRKENEATLAASIARIERNLEDKVDNMHKHDVTLCMVLDDMFNKHLETDYIVSGCQLSP